MRSVKPGRGPSAMGAVGGVIAIAFGVLWTIVAYNLTQNSPFSGFSVIFPLFGVLFIIVGIVNTIYSAGNAVRRDRYSLLDITDDREEPDPLNQEFGRQRPAEAEPADSDDAIHFCPHCGAKVSPGFEFCPRCGKRL